MSASNINIGELIGDDLFRDCAEGRAGINEKKQERCWIRQAPKKLRLASRAQVRIIVSLFTTLAKPYTSTSWDRLQNGMACPGRSQCLPVSHWCRRPAVYSRAPASVLVIIVARQGGMLIHFLPDHTSASYIQRTIQAAYGERKKIMISNGASLVFNAHSNFIYLIIEEQPPQWIVGPPGAANTQQGL